MSGTAPSTPVPTMANVSTERAVSDAKSSLQALGSSLLATQVITVEAGNVPLETLYTSTAPEVIIEAGNVPLETLYTSTAPEGNRITSNVSEASPSAARVNPAAIQYVTTARAQIRDVSATPSSIQRADGAGHYAVRVANESAVNIDDVTSICSTEGQGVGGMFRDTPLNDADPSVKISDPIIMEERSCASALYSPVQPHSAGIAMTGSQFAEDLTAAEFPSKAEIHLGIAGRCNSDETIVTSPAIKHHEIALESAATAFPHGGSDGIFLNTESNAVTAVRAAPLSTVFVEVATSFGSADSPLTPNQKVGLFFVAKEGVTPELEAPFEELQGENAIAGESWNGETLLVTSKFMT